MNALQQLELVDVEAQEEQQRFEITSLDSLNWVFRKVAALKSKEAEVKSLADAERIRINQWENGELLAIHSSLNYFEALITNYHAQQLAENPKAKTLSTPYGKSKSLAKKAAPKQVDKEALLTYAKEVGFTEFIKEEVKWGELKKHLYVHEVDGQQIVIDEDGQIVPGVAVEPAGVSFKVEV
ncbi:host-nuclease inhibitor Gam family protein [Ectobacillus ponti]|uniref:Host-nuclease inhibitor Gam family protein n=1 Tax=Ectobacillus ponti TaxID=2961894 RepID=A0AA42BRP1_9BACI|nr:host-nuclease inhibitor Gam family protein [Ectobacillus ponti]MCP8969699.1 host-nuclease inhibitor Gam family protein [Ectobacillus ponti]